MPNLRPFPFPSLSIGIDIAHTPRIAKLVASRRTLPRFLRKVLTSREERDFHLRFPQTDTKSAESDSGQGGWSVDEVARFLAGRWAAKEAVVKACSWRRLMFDEIQILKDEGSKRVYGVVLDRSEVRGAMRRKHVGHEDVCVQEQDVEEEDEASAGQIVKISISHDGEYATAVCLAADESSAGS
jgi:holo-[acyl-carrier protein] synthase